MSVSNYVMKIPRAHYDRWADAFDLDDTYFIRLDTKLDMVTFAVTESQRKWFSSFAKSKENLDKPAKYRSCYWICQMFLPRNIKKWQVTG
jgi:hypothetical protein